MFTHTLVLVDGVLLVVDILEVYLLSLLRAARLFLAAVLEVGGSDLTAESKRVECCQRFGPSRYRRLFEYISSLGGIDPLLGLNTIALR